MIRAAASGAINFAEADPASNGWWKKLYWILDELARQNDYAVAQARQQYWTTLASNSRLENEAFTTAVDNAAAALRRVTTYAYPWLKEELKGPDTARDSLIAEYRELFGEPGEPRYEAQMVKIRAVMAKLRGRQRLHHHRES